MNSIESFALEVKPTVLIVDDVRINQQVLVDLLKPHYQIKVAGNGFRALEITQNRSSIDLILLDIKMPEMNGYEVFQKLKENPDTCDIPVIFITGLADEDAEAYGLQLGAVDYISKPFNPEIVLPRIRNQILLRQSLKKLSMAETVFENTMEAIVIINLNDKIVCVNPSFSRITGYGQDEVMGENFKTFTQFQNEAGDSQVWAEIKSKNCWQGEVWGQCKNGESCVMLLSLNTVFDHRGEANHRIIQFADITQRKRHEETIELNHLELQKAKLEVEKACQIKSDFLSSMSHELFTPMNAILGFAQLLQYEDLTEQQQDHVERILTSGHQLLDLIKEVLYFSIIASGKLALTLESLNLATLVQNCVTLMQPLACENNIKIINNLSATDHITVVADSSHLKQVLLNLVSNAIKYNCVGGSVSISCEIINSQTAKINVTDTGKGLITDAQLNKLFLPFERLNAKNSNIEGAGLGLCISKKLIDAMNGRIGANSKEGTGSCFWIEIPLA